MVFQFGQFMATSLKSDFIQALKERDFIYQATDLEQLDLLCSKKEIVGYIGFDATAKSLQVGNLSAIMMLRILQKTGHTPIVLVGGGTSRVGDPSFRQVQRPIMTLDKIAANINGISKIFDKLLDFKLSSNKAILLNNDDWLSELKYIDFLRDYGSNFTVNRMLSFESVKSRLDKEEPLSFLEFNYMIMQAYDFYHINKHFDCVLQMGGSDQWGNIVNGVDLTKKINGNSLYGLTAPLVVNANGEKMGKTAAGATWLNDDMCSPYDYWQFWRNTDDRDVIRYLKKFTDIPINEIEKLSKLSGNEINEAKRILADEATGLIHGKEVLPSIHDAVKNLFYGGAASSDSIPCAVIEEKMFPMTIDELFTHVNLCESKGEFKRLVQGGGASFQNKIISDHKMKITLSDFDNGALSLCVGKKKHMIVKLEK